MEFGRISNATAGLESREYIVSGEATVICSYDKVMKKADDELVVTITRHSKLYQSHPGSVEGGREQIRPSVSRTAVIVITCISKS